MRVDFRRHRASCRATALENPRCRAPRLTASMQLAAARGGFGENDGSGAVEDPSLVEETLVPRSKDPVGLGTKPAESKKVQLALAMCCETL